MVFGSEGYCLRDGSLCDSLTIRPSYWRQMVEENPDCLPDIERCIRVEVEGPAYLPISRDYNSYGHWWLDVVPRLALLRRTPLMGASNLRVVIPADLESFARDILSECFELESERVVPYDPRREVVVCRSAILPTLGHRDYLFHPATSDIYTEVVDRVIPNALDRTPERLLYVTRSAFASTTKSRIVRQATNHMCAEELARSLGLKRLHPRRCPGESRSRCSRERASW